MNLLPAPVRQLGRPSGGILAGAFRWVSGALVRNHLPTCQNINCPAVSKPCSSSIAGFSSCRKPLPGAEGRSNGMVYSIYPVLSRPSHQSLTKVHELTTPKSQDHLLKWPSSRSTDLTQIYIYIYIHNHPVFGNAETAVC